MEVNDEGEKRQPMNARDCNKGVERRRLRRGSEDRGLWDKSMAVKSGGREGRSDVKSLSLTLECDSSRHVTDEKREITSIICCGRHKEKRRYVICAQSLDSRTASWSPSAQGAGITWLVKGCKSHDINVRDRSDEGGSQSFSEPVTKKHSIEVCASPSTKTKRKAGMHTIACRK